MGYFNEETVPSGWTTQKDKGKYVVIPYPWKTQLYTVEHEIIRYIKLSQGRTSLPKYNVGNMDRADSVLFNGA